MRILAVSDIHGDTGLVKRIEKIARKENVDLIIVAGDQTWFSQKVDKLVSPLTKKQTLMIHGNHETEDLIKKWEQMYPGLKNLHGKHFEKNGIGFFGSGTTDWGLKEDSERVFKELKKAHDSIKHLEKKIMVSHCPPEGSAIELLGFPGSYGVRKAIKKLKPNVVICGHIHEGAGILEEIDGAKVMNVSRTPTIFEI